MADAKFTVIVPVYDKVSKKVVQTDAEFSISKEGKIKIITHNDPMLKEYLAETRGGQREQTLLKKAHDHVVQKIRENAGKEGVVVHLSPRKTVTLGKNPYTGEMSPVFVIEMGKNPAFTFNLTVEEKRKVGAVKREITSRMLHAKAMKLPPDARKLLSDVIAAEKRAAREKPGLKPPRSRAR